MSLTTMTCMALCSGLVHAQDIKKDTAVFTIGAYTDAGYSWFSNGFNQNRQVHEAVGAYANNFGLNIAQFSVGYEADRIHSKATFQYGDIPKITFTNGYSSIQEAYAGVRIAGRLWLDAGAFKSHIGSESFLPKDNLLSTLSLATFYAPFFHNGVRLVYDTEGQWHFELHLLNGYNQRFDDNDYLSYGVHVSKRLKSKWKLGYSNLLGRERVASLHDDYLIYQNMYANYEGSKWSLKAAVDGATAWGNFIRSQNTWINRPLLAANIVARYRLSEQFSVSARGEVFSDERSINSRSYSPQLIFGEPPYVIDGGMTIYGGTVGFEYKPSALGFVRIESRTLYNPEAPTAVYPDGYENHSLPFVPMTNGRTQVLATIGVYLDKSFKFAK